MKNISHSLSICASADCPVAGCPVSTCPILKALSSLLSATSGFETADKIKDEVADEVMTCMPSEKATTAKPALTARQRHVLWALVNGYSIKESASLLGISPFTVRAHLSSLSLKLGINKKYEIIKYGVALGLCGIPLSRARDLDAASHEIVPRFSGSDARLTADPQSAVAVARTERSEAKPITHSRQAM